MSCEVGSCAEEICYKRTSCCHVPLCDNHYDELVKNRYCCEDCSGDEICDACFDINGYMCSYCECGKCPCCRFRDN